MNRPRLIRGLRIAWSAWWGVVCVLLIVLWVRSYRWFEYLDVLTSNTTTFIAGYGNGAIGISPNVPTAASYWGDERYKTRSIALSELTKWMASPQYLSRVRFGITRKPHLGVTMPCWFLTATTAALSILPWLRYFPRRFSLRTLLIAFTLVAVVLGLAVLAIRS